MAELRYELKFIGDGRHLPYARHWLRLHPAAFRPTFPTRRVNSLYLDTPDLDNLWANFIGVDVRQKLRLRWYGDTAAPVEPFLELKRKENQVGEKQRVPLPSLDLTASWSDTWQTIRQAAGPTWAARLATTGRPVLLNHYQRDYYATFDGRIRATLDYDPAAYDQRFLPRLNLRFPLPVPNVVVIELKAAPAEMTRLQAIAGAFPLPRSRHSKYVSSLMSEAVLL
jgi:hypothetical protein